METLWPLRTWIRHIIERRKPPEFTVEKALVEDAAEREATITLRRPLAEEHSTWDEKGLFAVRSRLMADAYPLFAFCPPAMSGRDEHHDLFRFIHAPALWKRSSQTYNCN